MKKTAILATTQRGRLLAERIAAQLEGAEICSSDHGVRKALEDAWHRYDHIICVMAVGIVVRCVAPLCRDKFEDPGVVVVDEVGRHAVSLLAGHIGGANLLAQQIGSICGAEPVITTGSDVSGHTAIDLWAVEQNLALRNPESVASIATSLLDTGSINVFQQQDYVKSLPGDFRTCKNPLDADIVIALNWREEEHRLVLVPRIHYIGLGCRRGVSVDEFSAALNDLQENCGLELDSVAGVASIDIKKDEAALLRIAELHKWPVRFFDRQQIGSVSVPTRSEAVHRNVGVYGVCEAAALLAASAGTTPGHLLIKKIKWKRITAAVAQRAF
jgi:cobalt-precorrin 5A hydrolase